MVHFLRRHSRGLHNNNCSRLIKTKKNKQTEKKLTENDVMQRAFVTNQETTVQLSRKHVTHDLSSATDSHATNDRTTQRKEGSDAVQHEDSKHTALGYCYFVAVIH